MKTKTQLLLIYTAELLLWIPNFVWFAMRGRSLRICVWIQDLEKEMKVRLKNETHGTDV